MSYVSAKRTFYVSPSYLRKVRENEPQDNQYVLYDHRLQLNEQVRVPLHGVTTMTLQSLEPVPSAEGMRWEDFQPFTDEFTLRLELPVHPYSTSKMNSTAPVHTRILNFIGQTNTVNPPFAQLVEQYFTVQANDPIPESVPFIFQFKGIMSGRPQVTRITRIENGIPWWVNHEDAPVVARLPPAARERQFLYERESSKVTSDIWTGELNPVLGHRGDITDEYMGWDDNINYLDGKQKREGGQGEFCDRLNYAFKLLRPEHLFYRGTDRGMLGFGIQEWDEYYQYIVPLLLNQVRVSAEPDTNRVFVQLRSGPVLTRLLTMLWNPIGSLDRDQAVPISRETPDEFTELRLGNIDVLGTTTTEYARVRPHVRLDNNNALCYWMGVNGPLDVNHNRNRYWSAVAGITAMCRVEISAPYPFMYQLMGLAHENHKLTGSGYLWVEDMLYLGNGDPDNTIYNTEGDIQRAQYYFNFEDPQRIALYSEGRPIDRTLPANTALLNDIVTTTTVQQLANGDPIFITRYLFPRKSMIPLLQSPLKLVHTLEKRDAKTFTTSGFVEMPLFNTLVPRMRRLGLWHPTGDNATLPSPWRLGELPRNTLFVFMDTQASSTMSVLSTADFDTANLHGNFLENQSYLNLVAVISNEFKLIYSAPVDLPAGTNFQQMRLLIKNIYGDTIRLRGELAYYFTMQTETQQSTPNV